MLTESAPPSTTATEALLFATARAEDGGPAALLGVSGTTLVARLVRQLDDLGVARVSIVTRPEWRTELEAAAAGNAPEVTVIAAGGLGGDLERAAEIAGHRSAPLLVGNANVLAHGQAVAELVSDRRPASSALVGHPPDGDDWAFPVRSAAARIASAGSPFHRVEGATASFLGLVKVDPGDRPRLAAAATELAGLAAHPPAAWEEEAARRAETGEPERDPDVPALLLVGLVRGGVRVAPRQVRELFLTAPHSASAAGAAEEELAARDEERALLDSAVKATDSPFTTFLVSSYSKHIVLFAARRGWSPNAVSVAAMAVGVAAATAFALGSRAGLVAGAVLLQASFTLDCVDGQLARFTRTSSSFGAWLDRIFDRTKEYIVYAGLALGATRGFDDDVWLLAACTLGILTVRHVADVSWVAGHDRVAAPREDPLDRPVDVLPNRRQGTAERWPGWVTRTNEIIRLPIGERFALVSLTAAFFSPRVTFVALLVWGGIAALYAQSVRIVLSTPAGARILRALTR